MVIERYTNLIYAVWTASVLAYLLTCTSFEFECPICHLTVLCLIYKYVGCALIGIYSMTIFVRIPT